jgi:hypothetical protein
MPLTAGDAITHLLAIHERLSGPHAEHDKSALGDVVALLSTAVAGETAWLIHGHRSGKPIYWCGVAEWSEDPNDAVRFARQLDAERVRGVAVPAAGTFVTEHVWMSAPVTMRTGAPTDAAMIEQFCRDLATAHDELLRSQGVPDAKWNDYDWPEWSGPAHSIRWATERLGRDMSKRGLRDRTPPRAVAAKPNPPITIAVYSHPDCPWNYCANQDICKPQGLCQHAREYGQQERHDVSR